MAQILGPDNIPQVVKAGANSLTLAATYKGRPTRISVGGQQYVPASSLTLNTNSTGFNGLDTGALTNTNDLYYVYAVVSSGSLGMVASLAAPSIGPSGFTAYTLIGAFYSASTGNQILATVSHDGVATTPLVSWSPTFNNSAGLTAISRGQFQRIGNFLHLQCSINFQSGGNGTSTSPLQINLPLLGISAPTGEYAQVLYRLNLTGPNDVPVNGYLVANGNNMQFSNGNTPAALSNGNAFGSSGGSSLFLAMNISAILPINGWSTTLVP